VQAIAASAVHVAHCARQYNACEDVALRELIAHQQFYLIVRIIMRLVPKINLLTLALLLLLLLPLLLRAVTHAISQCRL